ncbi:M28 family peptidase [Paucihalobacter ruber]|uniref:M28 family peptidase n=1 Tax=Paucihalobacter ruber TaxID=2567861 RepID=A0A506PNZ3_9FLAO|nr:M28 family peptidase [Paucihalobacter ruber]TPV35421.1 M28 family peptidase [Paucihalobacter ruber]
MRVFQLVTLLFLTSIGLMAQSEADKVQATVDKASIEGHIYFLADDLLKGREAGTAENKIAASYLANTLRSYGVQPNPKTDNYYQEVRLKKTSPPKNVSISLNNQSLPDYAILSAAELSVNNNAVYLGYGLEADYSNKDVTGKLLILKSGSAETNDSRAAFRLRRQKQQLAREHGAIGIVELLNAEAQMWSIIEHNFNTSRLALENNNDTNSETNNNTFAYVWVLDTDSKLAASLTPGTSVPAKVNMSAPVEESLIDYNVIGVVEGTDPQLKNEYIIYSAHYDHVGIGDPDDTGDTIYNGARDNAVGTVTVLSMAENLAKYPTKRSALFILFTGEEKGLLGSEFYVENPVLPLEQMVFCFNSDNAGYNDTSLATIVGLNRTTATQHITTAAETFGLTATDDPAPEQGLFDRSDNVHFAAKGIPAPTFSLGFTAFNGDVTKYYHRPGDEADTLDYDYLYKFFQAYVLSGRNIGNAAETPFWVEGDKYEAVGKTLYGLD